MTRDGILNAELCRALAACGHTDRFVIADCGLPIPDGAKLIDLSLIRGVPSFMQTLKAVFSQLVVESFVLAEEMADKNPQLLTEVLALMGDLPHEEIPHSEFKELTHTATVIVRTGEATPFANIALICGVNF